jgi:hypothetical protein
MGVLLLIARWAVGKCCVPRSPELAGSEGGWFVLVVGCDGLAVPEVGGSAVAFDPLQPRGEVFG